MSQNIWDDLWGSSSKEETAPKSSFNAMELAKYFQSEFQNAQWHSGFGLINVRALAGAIAKWKSRSDADTVRSMINLYMSDASVRGKNPGWTDFLVQAEQIHAKLKPATPAPNKWDLMEQEWERKYGNAE